MVYPFKQKKGQYSLYLRHSHKACFFYQELKV